jgi:hypothetical protein
VLRTIYIEATVCIRHGSSRLMVTFLTEQLLRTYVDT